MKHKLMKISSYISSLTICVVYACVYFLLNCKISEETNLSSSGLNANQVIIGKVIVFILLSLVASSIVLVSAYYLSNKENFEENRRFIKILSFSRNRTTSANYLLSNILPILSVNTENYILLLFVFLTLVFLGLIYYKNDMYYMNPLYDLLGLKVYSANIKIANSPDEISDSPINFDQIIITKDYLSILFNYTASPKTTGEVYIVSKIP